MPPDATPAMHAIAAHMALRMGLRLLVDDVRPLPYAYREAVRAGLVETPQQAMRAITRLVKAGVIEPVGELPRLPHMAHGTRLYAPPSALPEAAGDVEAAAGMRRPVQASEPHVEAPQEVGMGDAVGPRPPRDLNGLGAPERGAGSRAIAIEHEADATASAGGSPRLLVDVLASDAAVVERLIEAFDAIEITTEETDDD